MEMFTFLSWPSAVGAE